MACHLTPGLPGASRVQVEGGAAPTGTFDVAVDLALRVQVVQAPQDLPQDRGNVGLLQGAGLKLRTNPRPPPSSATSPLGEGLESVDEDGGVSCSLKFAQDKNKVSDSEWGWGQQGFSENTPPLCCKGDRREQCPSHTTGPVCLEALNPPASQAADAQDPRHQPKKTDRKEQFLFSLAPN